MQAESATTNSRLKAVYELAYDLNNRPAGVGVPLHGILHMITAGET